VRLTAVEKGLRMGPMAQCGSRGGLGIRRRRSQMDLALEAGVCFGDT
jgi:hypothetical protein